MTAPILTQTLRFTRSTHNTHRYDSADDEAHLRSLYIRKAAFPAASKPPPIIVVTVTAPDGD